MGNLNVGINLTKKILMNTGMKSLLHSKPVKNINIAELGVCFPNGNINFQTEDAAIKYIKNRLLESLNQEQQFERAITKKGTRILSETNGNKYHCELPFTNKEVTERLSDRAVRDVEIWHSHPDMFEKGKTAPLSPPEGGDIATFNALHLKKIVAMNSKGEINSIEALDNYSSSKFKKFKNEFGNYMEKEVTKLLPEEIQKRIKEITEFCKDNNCTALSKEFENEWKNIEQLFIKAQSAGQGAELMHKFYKTADRYGMKYYTNFSNLV